MTRFQGSDALIARTGQRCLRWLVSGFAELADTARRQGTPDEAHQTALAELGMTLFLLSNPARPDWQGDIDRLHALLLNAYAAPGLHGFARSGPAPALIGQLAMRLGLGDAAEPFLSDAALRDIIADKAPDFPAVPVWKPLEMAFVLRESGLAGIAPPPDPALPDRITGLLSSVGMEEARTVYIFTHLVFFTTGFGRDTVPVRLRDAWLALARDALDRCCRTRHLDLIAELLSVAALLHLPEPERIGRGWAILAAAQAEDGAIRGTPSPGPALGEYHKCLVTVIAAQLTLCAGDTDEPG